MEDQAISTWTKMTKRWLNTAKSNPKPVLRVAKQFLAGAKYRSEEYGLTMFLERQEYGKDRELLH